MFNSLFISLTGILFLLIHPALAQRPPGPPMGGPDGGKRQPEMTAEEETKAYLTLDKNHDGNLTKDEVPARIQSLFTRADTDGDGTITSEEINAMVAKRFAAKAEHKGGPGGPPP